jgi:ActR/RegA family two-component response regulator
MEISIQTALKLFDKKINLLIVDDDDVLLDSLTTTFVSPLFNISTASTLAQAGDLIDSNPDSWHCWILDIDLGHGQCGLDLLSRYSGYQFAIVLSGLHRMALAAESIRLGARMAFDKDPSSIEQLHNEVCKTAALGFLLNGKCDHFDIFQLLLDDTVTTIEEWAFRGCIELRKLHRICDLYPPITPNFGLALYRAIYYLLRNPTDSATASFTAESRAKYVSWINYALRKYG